MRLVPSVYLLAILAGTLGVSACASRRGAPPMREFPFVYGSVNHMAPSERVLRTTASPAKVLAAVQDELMRASATGMQTVGSRALSVSEEEDARWQERSRIAREEWEAYRRRSRRDLEAIVRPEDLGSGPPEDPETPAVLLSARVWERDAATEWERKTTSGNSTTTRRWVTSDPVASEISFLVWRGGDDATHLYVTATPIIDGKDERESPTLALRWLPFARGFDEAALVRTYLKILRRRLPPAS